MHERETGVCKLGGMNLAGNVMHAPAFPRIVAEFAVASTAKGTHDQHEFLEATSLAIQISKYTLKWSIFF